MPWLPDFANAVELARRDTRATGRAEPVVQYLKALREADTHDLESVWPGQVVIHDPRAGEVRGHRELRRFVRRSGHWLAERKSHVETIASTCVGRRAVVELLVHLTDDGRKSAWPVAVVAESPDELAVVFRIYCSQWPVDQRRHVRRPVLVPSDDHPGDVVGRYHAALEAGDAETIVSTFAQDGYFREPTGRDPAHRGEDELRAFFTRRFSAGGGIVLEHCAVTDDGVRCALEYNCVRWGRDDVTPQAGLGVYERDRHGKLAAARVYDDIEPPRPDRSADDPVVQRPASGLV